MIEFSFNIYLVESKRNSFFTIQTEANVFALQSGNAQLVLDRSDFLGVVLERHEVIGKDILQKRNIIKSFEVNSGERLVGRGKNGEL